MWITTNWKILKEIGIADHLTCLLKNLYAGQEVTVRIGHGTTDWFQTGEGVCQGCILLCWLFDLHAEYIMWNAGLDEAQAEAQDSVQFSHSVVSDPLWPHGLHHASLPCPSPTSQSLVKLMSIESLMLSNHLMLCCPLLLPLVFSSIRVFCNESVLCIRWPKYWSFSFSISPSSEYSGLISFRID